MCAWLFTSRMLMRWLVESTRWYRYLVWSTYLTYSPGYFIQKHLVFGWIAQQLPELVTSRKYSLLMSMRLVANVNIKDWRISLRWLVGTYVMQSDIESTQGQIEVNIGKLIKLGKTRDSSFKRGNLWWPSVISLHIFSHLIASHDQKFEMIES